MAKKNSSALHELLVGLRRVVVLVVAAFALAMNWPLPVVAMRIGILWAALIVLCSAAEVMFQYLSHRALQQQSGAEPTAGASGS